MFYSGAGLSRGLLVLMQQELAIGGTGKTWKMRVVALLALVQLTTAFLVPSTSIPRALTTRRQASITVGPASEIPPGERKVIDTDQGAVIVTNVKGTFFAVNAKCPHLGLPMKRGAIGDDATITCNFHKSTFSLKDGKCVAWSESVFGLPGTQGLAGLVGGLGGEKNSPATVYPMTEGEDGLLTLEL